MMKPLTAVALFFAFCLALSAQAANLCTAQSGPSTAALVELYTSEGCSSCPPADNQLNRLTAEIGQNASVVPLALHVTYWDGLGWQDMLAQSLFDARQTALTAADHGRFVYTPEFFVNGAELRAWSSALPDVIRQINARPAPVSITLTSISAPDGALTLDVSLTARDPRLDGVLYLAVTENGIESYVPRGENRGATLSHDDVVRVWLGPIALAHGAAQVRQTVQLSPAWNRQHMHAVAFVQDGTDGAVLQAVATGACGIG
jgi:hypothetical protein